MQIKEVNIDILPTIVFVIFMVISIFSKDKHMEAHNLGENA